MELSTMAIAGLVCGAALLYLVVTRVRRKRAAEAEDETTFTDRMV